ncbi:sensor histidine kinase [Larkinella rosea]|uniref:histidine kinase n=1 Tax=Larkinella rosea TaxID=2025312 RepID=A0A3P1BGD4_9BACT|nr:ATP-binding protein [Larkinella rosea]RRA99872.1 histidine kinase [Larkinella rosea]
MDCLALLKTNPNFQHVPEAQLSWLVDQSDCLEYPADTLLYSPGDPTDHFYILLKGRIRFYFIQQGQQQELRTAEEGALEGVLPFSRMVESIAYWQTLEPTALLSMHRDHFREMIQNQYELTETLVQVMTSRVRESTRLMQQNDKMMALGRMSAGLAHELNNPVSAVVRSSDTLKSHLQNTPQRFKDVMALRVTDEMVDRVSELLFRKMNEQTGKNRLSLLERSNLEDALLDWFDDNGVSDDDDLTESLIDFGFTIDDLDTLLEDVAPEGRATVLNWMVNNLMTERLVNDITEASKRIAVLVNAIKSYTHMDRGTGRECIHIREGIDSTLVLLKHKLKEKNIQVDVQIPDDLPQLEAFPSELNQVWTNLIDNAVDAMSEGGHLQITGEVDHEFELIRVIDNGSGIPGDQIDHIFEPFFTTKAVGKGTGLGLDIAQGIIRHHNGRIYVTSEPGRTEFKVCIPIDGGREEGINGKGK